MKEKLLRALEKRTNKAKKGFTLVELLVVIAIIAILATVSVVGYLGFTTQARKSNDMQELAQYKTIVTAYLIDGSETVHVDETDDTTTGTTATYNGYYYFTCNANTSGGYNVTISYNSNEDVETNAVPLTTTSTDQTAYATAAVKELIGDDIIADGNLTAGITYTAATSSTSAYTTLSTLHYYRSYTGGTHTANATADGCAIWNLATGEVDTAAN